MTTVFTKAEIARQEAACTRRERRIADWFAKTNEMTITFEKALTLVRLVAAQDEEGRLLSLMESRGESE